MMRRQGAMLANTTSLDTLDTLIESDMYWADQKLDGHRGLLHVDDGRVRMVGRSGLDLPVIPTVYNPFKPMLDTGRWVFDGEYLDKTYYIFDVVEAGGGFITPKTPYEDRRTFLEDFCGRWNPGRFGPVTLVPTFRTSKGKARLVETVRTLGGEGMMFKRRTAPYSVGRSPNILKAKFRNDVDCVVTKRGTDGKDNMTLCLWDSTDSQTRRLVEVGECTGLAGDGPRVKVGDVVTVIYQNASKNNRLVMPTKPKIRTDKAPDECVMDQLVYFNKTVILEGET